MVRRGGAVGAARDLAGAFVPLSVRELEREIDDRLRKVPTRLNEYGFDPFGFSPERVRRVTLLAALLHRHYFRVETHGIHHVPAGRALLIANHAGQLPFDGMMVAVSMLLEAEPPRLVRAMGEYWLARLPWVGVMMSRAGLVVGTPETCAEMLQRDECVLVFPEGVRGMNKPFRERYRLQRFGQGFVRLALETETPVVPVGVVGSEEQQPGLANLPALGRLLRMPAFPITPTFPWLGPLGLLPLPTKYRIHFGEPMQLEGAPDDDDEAIQTHVDRVRSRITALLAHGRRARRGIFT